MCLQCVAEAVTVCDLTEYLILMKATVDSVEWKSGEYAIVMVNDPEIIFTDVKFGLEDSDDLPLDSEYDLQVEKVEHLLNKLDFSTLMRFQAEFKQFTKYTDPDSDDPSFDYWLYDFITEKLKEI